MVRWILIGVASAILVGCGGGSTPFQRTVTAQTTERPAPPKLDLSSPDRAIRSYWNTVDHVRMVTHEQTEEQKARAQYRRDRYLSVVTPEYFGNSTLAPLETFSRDIVEVKLESETRAVIVAVIKNTSPIPAGAEVTRFDEVKRRDGDRLKYILEKDPTGWKVAEQWEWDTYPSPGWQKREPVDPRPSAPSLTYDGR